MVQPQIVQIFKDTFTRFDRIHERNGRIDGRTLHSSTGCTASRGKNVTKTLCLVLRHHRMLTKRVWK